MMLKELYRKLTNYYWNIGFFEWSDNCIEKGESWNIKWLKSDNKNHWFADPFILNDNENEIELFVEDYYYKSHKAVISKIVVDKKNYSLKNLKVILELDSHLSYPFIFRENNKIYVMPENSASGALNLYEYDEVEMNLKCIFTLVDEPITDAILTKNKDEYYIFCTKLPNPNNNILYIYHSQNLFTQFSLFQQVKFEDNVARCGGDLFTYNGKTVRPAQNCNMRYGNGLVFQYVLKKKNYFNFEEISRFKSKNKKMNLGLHTFNIYHDMCVVDSYGYIHPHFANFFVILKTYFLKYFSKHLR